MATCPNLVALFQIVDAGCISSEEIDSKKLIDQHYYAIASKVRRMAFAANPVLRSLPSPSFELVADADTRVARLLSPQATILKPHELNVPADKFKAQFGLEWQAALDSGKVMNAMDGCAALGKTADEMDTLWGICKKAKKLVKFGGGFYCGLIEVEGKDSLYIFNGFFMSMRSKFTAPGLSIYYYVVEYDGDKLAWSDFRGKVLGPTDPTEAPADSLRGQIFSKWEALGLKAVPDVGDNGVHASASPFEALAERNNWLGKSIADDSFGAALIGAGISQATIEAWSVDPQVLVGGKKGSLFDSVEDQDSGACLDALVATNKENGGGSSSNNTNTAFVFIKPHAVTEAVKDLVSSELAAKGIKILEQGSIASEDIDSKKLIDQHYYAIASKATILKPHELNVPADKFKAQFGLEWQAALDSGKVMNAMDGCAALGKTADEMDTLWGICKKAKKLVKFGGGFYCGLIEVEGKDSLYIFNGFFMSMRSKFTAPGLSIYYYVVEYDGDKLAWSDFRGKVLGPTDPTEAPADSLRGQIFSKWEALGLKAVPDVGDNGVHASASPFEALAERNNWLGKSIADDSFGAALIGAGISQATIEAWSVDPQVLVGGKKGSLFDSVEDQNSADCLAALVATNKENTIVKPVKAVAAWDPNKWAEEPKKMPKEVQEAYRTYSDDGSFGKVAPALDTLEWIKGDAVAYSSEKPTVVVFWAKFAKGDYTTIVGVSDIFDDFKEQAQFIGISLDPVVDDAKSFLKKIGTAMPELDVKKCVVPYSLAFDTGKTVKEAFRTTSGLMSLTASACFIIDAKGKILWREQFGQGYAPKKGQLREQLRRHCAGEGLLSNGKKPVVEDSDEDLADGDMDCDYDSDLGF